MQITEYGKVIDEFELVMNENNEISVISNHYSQWIDSSGSIRYGTNQLVEIDFQPMGSLGIVNDNIDLPARLISGDTEFISFQVENEGLLTASGFDVTVTQVSGDTETVIYKDSIEQILHSSDSCEVTFPWQIPADISDTAIFVEVNEHDVASNPARTRVAVPYSSVLEIADVETVWTGTEARLTATVTNTGNKPAAPAEATLAIFDTDDEGKVYASAAVPALASGESCTLSIPFSPAPEDFESLGFIDLELKIVNEEIDAKTYSRLLVSKPVMAQINGGADSVTIKPGKTAQVSTVAAPWNELAGNVTYIVDDPTIATVDSDGTIHAVSTGTTTLRASYAACMAEDTIEVVVSDTESAGGSSKPAVRDDAETGGDEAAAVKEFVDVHPVDHWAKSYVDYVVSSGIFSGTSDTTFSPDTAMTRGMVAKVLHNLEGAPESSYTGSFTDVAKGSWYEEAVYWAAGEGIVSGYGNGLYGPNDPVTREQLATILYRYAQSKGQGFTGNWMFLLDYADRAEVSDWAYEAMCWMTMKGIINGTGNDMLSPKGYATRAQVAAMLQRFCENVLSEEN